MVEDEERRERKRQHARQKYAAKKKPSAINAKVAQARRADNVLRMLPAPEWTCGCGYMNNGPVCTHCFRSHVPPIDTDN